MVAQPAMRDELDRVAAAVGVRVIQPGAASVPSRKAWTAAAAI
ncbi:MAG: helicase, partial [Actinomycetota bacterium]|nr:helicase [Actinomycetota bacterium]